MSTRGFTSGPFRTFYRYAHARSLSVVLDRGVYMVKGTDVQVFPGPVSVVSGHPVCIMGQV